MFDFGMVARHDTSATNDRNNAFGNRQAVFGATYLVPPRYVDKYVGDDGTGDAYRFLSGVPGGPLILMGFPTAWQEETIEAARSAVAFFKSARPVLRDGEVFHLTPDPEAPASMRSRATAPPRDGGSSSRTGMRRARRAPSSSPRDWRGARSST